MNNEGLWISQWSSLTTSEHLTILLIISFALLPFFIFALALWRSLKILKIHLIVSLITVASVGLGIYMIYYSLFISSGDQRGLIFIFVLPLNLLGSVLAAIISKKKIINI
jgi:hypothetical protein